MPVVDLGNGVTAWVRGTRRKKDICRFCRNRYVTKLCDFPIPVGDVGHKRTCDAGMCDQCATPIAHEVDYCPNHKSKRPAAQQTVLPLEGSDAS
jgi:hypothetical protein